MLHKCGPQPSASKRIGRMLAACLIAIVLTSMPALADHIHHLWYNNSNWQDEDLTVLSGGGIATSFGGITAFYTTPNDQLHVYYVDQSASHVHQLYYNGSSWSDEDLTNLTGGPTASPYGISGFAIGNLQHVFYEGTDNHMHQLYYNNSNWSDQDITALAGSTQASLGPMLAFATKPNNQFHVYYQPVQNLDLHQLYFNGTSWSDSDLTSLTGAYCYTDWLAGLAVQNQQHIVCPGFGGYSNNLDMLHIYYNNSIWTYEDITFRAGGSDTPMYLGTGVAVFGVTKPTRGEVYGVTDDTHIHQYAFQSNQWIDTDLSARIGAPTDSNFGNIIAFPTVPNNQFHIFYAPTTEVYQIYYNGLAWSVQDLTNGAGQADYNSGMAGFAIGNLQHVFYMSSGN